jgi:hypothetical protein
MELIEKVKGLRVSLLSLRVSAFIVMFVWTIEKFLNPQHSIGIMKRFYMIEGLGVNIVYALGVLQLLLVLGFVAGFKKRFTYGSILILHGISTLSTWSKLIDPWGPRNLLFFTAIPMLAALFALYKMREHDTLLALDKA